MKEKKMSRLESSKEVRRVLNRHGADLSYLHYGVYGRELRLSGALYRTDGGDFSSMQIESMIHDFQNILRGFMITGDLDNWRFTSDHIAYVGQKENHQDKYFEEIFLDKDEDDQESEAS